MLNQPVVLPSFYLFHSIICHPHRAQLVQWYLEWQESNKSFENAVDRLIEAKGNGNIKIVWGEWLKYTPILLYVGPNKDTLQI